MKVNFEITDNHAISIAGRHIDLHNNFDFVGLEYNVANREIKLNWEKSSGDWVSNIELPGLILTHSDVSFFAITAQVENRNYDVDDCLGELTFFPSTAREINNSITLQSHPNEDDDILYHFENGRTIRIHCEKIELHWQWDWPIKRLDNLIMKSPRH